MEQMKKSGTQLLRVAGDEGICNVLHWLFEIECCYSISVLCFGTSPAGESHICLAACCSLSLLPHSFLGSAEISSSFFFLALAHLGVVVKNTCDL